MEAPTAKIQSEDQGDIFDKCVLLMLSFSYGFGLKRKIKKTEEAEAETEEILDEEAADADKDWVESYKKTLQSKEFEAIKSADGKFKSYVDTRCLPTLNKLFQSGIYPLPIDLVADVDEAIESHKVRRQELVEAFLETYPERIKEAQEALGTLYSVRDYPSVEELRATLKIKTRYITIGTPDSLKSISQSLFQREKAKTKARWSEVNDVVTQALRVQAKDLLDHMVERLTPDADGKAKTFRGTMIDKMDDFLKTFESRNIGSDEELNEAIQQIRQITSGVDTKDLRTNGDVRTSTVKSLEEVKAKLDVLVTLKPSRMFSMDE